MKENVFLSSGRLDVLSSRIETAVEPTQGAYRSLRAFIQERLEGSVQVPGKWAVPSFAAGPEKYLAATAPLAEDGMTAYGCALMFRMTGESVYRERSIGILHEWISRFGPHSKRGDSRPAFCCFFLPMIFAADILKGAGAFGGGAPAGHMPERFDGFLTKTAIPLGDICSRNYRGCWGTALHTACAAYLRDGVLFERSIRRWQGLLDALLASDGALKREATRGGGRLGLLYTNRSLAALCLSASIAAMNGSDLYYYRTSHGKTLRDAVAAAAGWSASPETFPYWKKDPHRLQGLRDVGYLELIPRSWDDDQVKSLLDSCRPVEESCGIPFVTFTHGD